MPATRTKVLPHNAAPNPATTSQAKPGGDEQKRQKSNNVRSAPVRKKSSWAGGADSQNLVVKRSADIEERARILNHDDLDGQAEAPSTQPLKRKFFCASFVLNVLVLLLAGPLVLTIFCNDNCEYNSPNTVCAAVNKTDSYVCLNFADECQCVDSNLKGDNKCDPLNNNCGCDWDGGDCCTHDFETTFCSNQDLSLCKCRDPFAAKLCTLGTCNTVTAGDGQCDAYNNNCNCNWDGGDCCSQSYNCSQNCRIVGKNQYNLTISNFNTCDYIGSVHLRGDAYCEELESSFGCDCAGCTCALNTIVGTGCSGSGCDCKDASSPAFLAHNDADFTPYIPENYVPPARPDNSTQAWVLQDVCEYIDFEAYQWDDACTCPCRVSVRWYVNLGWIVLFGIVYFVYLVEAIFMQALLDKSKCRESLLGKRLMADFSSETLGFARRVSSKAKPAVAVQQFRDAPPVFVMRMDTYRSKRRHAMGDKPVRTAAARMRMTFWRDETANILGLDNKGHAKIWLKKTLCFDGYSTSTFFDKRRNAFIEQHASTAAAGEFQCYSEDFVVPNFTDYGIWSKPRNILIGSLPYLVCTFAGLSWFYRMFVECATTPFRVEVVKMISINDHVEKPRNGRSNNWRVVRAQQRFDALKLRWRLFFCFVVAF
jgi:hypothetical protein